MSFLEPLHRRGSTLNHRNQLRRDLSKTQLVKSLISFLQEDNSDSSGDQETDRCDVDGGSGFGSRDSNGGTNGSRDGWRGPADWGGNWRGASGSALADIDGTTHHSGVVGAVEGVHSGSGEGEIGADTSHGAIGQGTGGGGNRGSGNSNTALERVNIEGSAPGNSSANSDSDARGRVLGRTGGEGDREGVVHSSAEGALIDITLSRGEESAAKDENRDESDYTRHDSLDMIL